MKKLDEGMVALSLGAFLGLWHLGWALLVMLGLAQAILDWIYGIHFLNNPFTVGAFDLTRAAILVITTFVIGYLAGWLFAWLWNMWLKQK